MDRFPKIAVARVNSGRTVCGSFVDSEWVFHYIVTGKWIFQIEGSEYEAKPGDVVLLPPRLLHVVRQLGEGKHIQYVVHFNLGGNLLGKNLPVVVPLAKQHQKETIELYQRLQKEWRNGQPFADMFTGALLTQMLGLFFRDSGHARMSVPHSTLAWRNIEEAVQFLHDNFHRSPLLLSEISRAAKVSPNYLCRLFKQNTGHSPMAYLTMLRNAKAEELLLRSSKNCTEIAEIVGYSDIHLFSRSFKRGAGVSPTEFRRQHSQLSAP